MRVFIYLNLLVILVITIFVRLNIINNISINNFVTEPFLVTDLLGKGIVPPWRLIFFLDLANLFLIFLVGKKLTDYKFGLLSSLLYGVLPWMAYAQLFGSSYIFFLFFLLTFFYGVFILKENRIGFLIIIISSIIMLYSIFFSWFILPVLVFGISKVGLLKPSYLKIYSLVVVIIFIPILVMSFKNLTGLKNVYQNQVGIFSDPGLKNTIDVFQGESRKAGFSYFIKTAENKYLYLLKYFLLKSSTTFIPSTYFTPQEKLFNFSFTPPIYAGLLIPFLFGLYLMGFIKKIVAYLFILALAIPSVLSRQLVDLNRLTIFSPIIIFLICFGLIELYKKRARLIFGLFFYLSISLLIFQFVVTLSDIQFREPFRYKLSISQNFVWNKQ